MRARALRAPVSLGALPRQTGRCAPPCTHRSFSFNPPIYIKSIELGPPTSKAFFFPLDHMQTEEAMKYEVPSPTPPIAALLILPAIFLGSNYVAMRPYALIFSVFFIVFGSFLLFSSFSSLLFLFTFFLFFSSYLFLFFS